MIMTDSVWEITLSVLSDSDIMRIANTTPPRKPGGAAWASRRIERNDMLTAIRDKRVSPVWREMAGCSVDECKRHILGPPGTSVDLRFLRKKTGPAGGMLEFEVTLLRPNKTSNAAASPLQRIGTIANAAFQSSSGSVGGLPAARAEVLAVEQEAVAWGREKHLPETGQADLQSLLRHFRARFQAVFEFCVAGLCVLSLVSCVSKSR